MRRCIGVTKKSRLIQNAPSLLCRFVDILLYRRTRHLFIRKIFIGRKLEKQNRLINCLIDSNFTLKEILYFNSSGIHSQFYVSVHCINYMV